MEQLDEHLSGVIQPSPPSFLQIGLTFFIYFALLIIGFVIYFAVFESFGLFTFLEQTQRNINLPIKFIVILSALELIFLLSNYYLQGRLYDLFNQSVLKATLIPVLFWGSIILLALLYDINQGIPLNSLIVFTRISTILIGYATLCLIIAFYFKHQNRSKYYGALFLHWFIITTLFYTSVHLL